MTSGIKKAAIFDPATGTVVQLNKIAPEGEFKIREPIEVEDAKGGTVYAGDDSAITITAFDLSAFTQLETWMNNETPVQMVIEGVEEHILWYESVPMVVKKNYGSAPGQVNSLSITFTKKGGMHKIYSFKNLLLAAVGGAWPKDDDSNGRVDGLTFSVASGTPPNYSIASSSYQRISSLGSAVVTGKASIVFPISGVNLVAFNNIYSNANTFNSNTLTVKNYAGTTLVSDADSNVANTLTATTPANTYTIEFEFFNLSLSATAGTLTDVAVPFLGTDPNKYSDINY